MATVPVGLHLSSSSDRRPKWGTARADLVVRPSSPSCRCCGPRLRGTVTTTRPPSPPSSFSSLGLRQHLVELDRSDLGFARSGERHHFRGDTLARGLQPLNAPLHLRASPRAYKF
uniref:Uncharacterized protein n=1 Tax=Oryza sativa subsp. japonica TaxID=39947 RepID=Q6Z4T9_ORYSJ|nr:hypothetical protein [Oryza sativa Japonica Group]BAD05550.1 hypothetical protein [Oryza sativa Japonica Group]